ncbi:hypothetical protein Hypma_003070 [Hypsizygus marmoreus]|uniref:Uncharacterized protein n=1 Tax=Hypsizygus marmoreus TaxID=39966 RepID=A0A369J6W1_HYPMA|nr:hypothetical protein Hypma_003070 [Hypsizygus marmoreus]
MYNGGAVSYDEQKNKTSGMAAPRLQRRFDATRPRRTTLDFAVKESRADGRSEGERWNPGEIR